ncbi:hypothetical protein RSSM_01227 [Rhodopirellula sallentina SM41]|uniref:Uncharacterized protein n=1 Tax=Rhodopirellula sallentina SM41 TaxID=1263870 RepID=M5UHR5_9BACT|nr:hypothetical protein RSSM_01227 [Rhodopirellula sallentina SM41]
MAGQEMAGQEMAGRDMDEREIEGREMEGLNSRCDGRSGEQPFEELTLSKNSASTHRYPLIVIRSLLLASIRRGQSGRETDRG